MKQIVIIGGGISGLSAAYYVSRAATAQKEQVNITLLEQTDKLGGKIETKHHEGFIIERGPDSFLSRKTPLLDLSVQLGLDTQWVPTNPQANKTYVLHQQRLHRLPPGLVLGIPTSWKPFVQTKLISPAGKMRAALDLFLPRRIAPPDESLGFFLEKRLGKEIVQHITEPLLSGIYAGDAYALSVEATFPQFKALVQKKRSLILGMLAQQKQTQAQQALPDIAKKSRFLSFRSGLSSLVHKLEETLHDQNVNLAKHTHVRHIKRDRDHYAIHYDLNSSDAHAQSDTPGMLTADAVIITTPAHITAQLLPELNEAGSFLQTMKYVSVANVILAFTEEQLRDIDLDGSGFVVPRSEDRNITACTWTSSKWGHVAPQGKVLLRAYVGRAGAEDIVFQKDEYILSCVQKDLREIMGIDAQPLFYEVNRWINAMPQYAVNHRRHVDGIRQAMQTTYPGIFLCGATYDGVGLPDCIASGRLAAEKACSYVQLY